jgi:hypothetical protein
MPGSNARQFDPQNLLEVCTRASIHDPRTRRRRLSLDRQDLEQLCQQTLAETDFKRLGSRFVGKVRVSCFELVVGTIPLKGQILNQMAAFWFEQTREVEEPR